MPHANRVPATRSSVSPWLDTSIATAPDPCVAHARQESLQLGRFRRRVHDRQHIGADVNLDRADEAGRHAGLRERALEHERRRGLSIRPGDPDDGHGGRRTAEDRRRRGPARTSNGRHTDLRRFDVEPTLDEQRGRPARDGVAGERVTVRAFTRVRSRRAFRTRRRASRPPASTTATEGSPRTSAPGRTCASSASSIGMAGVLSPSPARGKSRTSGPACEKSTMRPSSPPGSSWSRRG